MSLSAPPQTLPQLVASSASVFADRIAIQDGDVTITYSELHLAGRAAAKAFMAAACNMGSAQLFGRPISISGLLPLSVCKVLVEFWCR
ncbi:hypothetical protein [Oceanicoccus sp. KOV_DT_Chl]|uniref:hypothetical protein n=1 Tax=Oceanicoccus sp. KOV_DT_Chl TaxID=1904639 RepID=UPI001F212F03|nr:hypothetical protein [Oceanicoccus sp. KOV_DT_Chl]